MNQKIENRVLWALLTLFGLYITLRAWLLPVTVDEAATAVNHVPRLVVDTLFYEKEANPNNHILNTLLIKIFTGIFGWHHFVLRLPVLLGGLLYGWASLQLVKRFSADSWVRIFSLLMLFGNPYLLEFFSLARGYGLAAGLMTAALWQAWVYFDGNDPRALRRSFLLAGFAVYANFTLLIFWAPFTFMALTAAWQKNASFSAFWNNTKPALTALGVFVLLWITPLKRLSKDSEIVNWNALGTYVESIQRSLRAAIHANAYLGSASDATLTWLVLAGAVLAILVAAWRWVGFRGKLAADPKVFFTLLLLGVAAANIAQVRITHTPYLQSRLALFYWPLFAMSIGASAEWIRERFGKAKTWFLMAPLLVLMLINLVRTLDLRQSFEWFHDTDTFTVLEYIKKTYQAENRSEPYLFDTEWFMQNSYIYHLEKGNYGYDKYAKQTPFHGARPPLKEADFFYGISDDRKREAEADFEPVLKIPNSSLVLFRHKK